MRLEVSSLNPPSSAAASATASEGLMSQWRVGAIVEAIAVRNIDDGQLWLNIGSQRVPARIASGDASGPANGERLQLRVLRDRPVVALESILAEDPEATAVNDGLRRFLPRQSSSAPLFANLALLNARGAAALGKPVADAAQKLWSALSSDTELSTADGLAAAVKRSGASLEQTLATGDSSELQQAVARDIKALLSSLKQALTRSGATTQLGDTLETAPLPSLRGSLAPLDRAAATLVNIDTVARAINELAGQTDGALARINTLQLVNAEAGSAASAWLLELPFRHDGNPETIRFRFERDRREGGDGGNDQQNWTVEAAMDLRVGGALHARVTLHGTRVGVQLRAQSNELLAQLQTHSKELIAVLQDAGLQVDRVQCLHGMPTEERAPGAAPLFATPLLDIRV